MIEFSQQDLDNLADALRIAIEDTKSYIKSGDAESNYEGDEEGWASFNAQLQQWEQLWARIVNQQMLAAAAKL